MNLKVRSITDVITNSSSEVSLLVIPPNPIFDMESEKDIVELVYITDEWIKKKLETKFYWVSTKILEIKPNNKDYFYPEQGSLQDCIKHSEKWPLDKKIDKFMQAYSSKIDSVRGKYLIKIKESISGKRYASLKSSLSAKADKVFCWLD